MGVVLEWSQVESKPMPGIHARLDTVSAVSATGEVKVRLIIFAADPTLVQSIVLQTVFLPASWRMPFQGHRAWSQMIKARWTKLGSAVSVSTR